MERAGLAVCLAGNARYLTEGTALISNQIGGTSCGRHSGGQSESHPGSDSSPGNQRRRACPPRRGGPGQRGCGARTWLSRVPCDWLGERQPLRASFLAVRCLRRQRVSALHAALGRGSPPEPASAGGICASRKAGCFFSRRGGFRDPGAVWTPPVFCVPSGCVCVTVRHVWML